MDSDGHRLVEFHGNPKWPTPFRFASSDPQLLPSSPDAAGRALPVPVQSRQCYQISLRRQKTHQRFLQNGPTVCYDRSVMRRSR